MSIAGSSESSVCVRGLSSRRFFMETSGMTAPFSVVESQANTIREQTVVRKPWHQGARLSTRRCDRQMAVGNMVLRTPWRRPTRLRRGFWSAGYGMGRMRRGRWKVPNRTILRSTAAGTSSPVEAGRANAREGRG